MKSNADYQKIAVEYKDIMQKLEIQFKIMLNDLKIFKNREYTVHDGKIGYK